MDVAFGIQQIVVIKVHILKKILCQSLFSLHDIKDIYTTNMQTHLFPNCTLDESYVCALMSYKKMPPV